MPTPRARSFTDAGVPAASYLLYTYAAGTTTPKAAFTDAAGLVPHPNPIVLDAKGEVLAYFDGNYKLELKTPLGVTVTGYPVDNFETPLMPGTLSAVTGSGVVGFLYSATYAAGSIGRWLKDLALSTGSSFIGFIQSATGGVLRTVQDKLREFVTVTDLGCVNDGNAATYTGTDNSAALQALLNNAIAAGIVNQGGATRIFPSGVFCFDTPLVVNSAGVSFLRLIGNGNGTRLIYRGATGTGLSFISTGYDGTYEKFNSRITLENFMVFCQPAQVALGNTVALSFINCAEVKLTKISAHYANSGFFIKDTPIFIANECEAINNFNGVSLKKTTTFPDSDLAGVVFNNLLCSGNEIDVKIDGGRDIKFNDCLLASKQCVNIRATGSTSASDQVELVTFNHCFFDYQDFTTSTVQIGNAVDTSFQIKQVSFNDCYFASSASFTKAIINCDSPLLISVIVNGGYCSEVVPKFLVIGSSCLPTLEIDINNIGANSCLTYRVTDERSGTKRSELFEHYPSLQLNPDFLHFPTGGYFPFGYDQAQPGNIARTTAAFVTGDCALSLVGTGSPTPPAACIWYPQYGELPVEQGTDVVVEWIVNAPTTPAKNTLIIVTTNIDGTGAANTLADPVLTSVVQEYANGFKRLIHAYKVPNNKVVTSMRIQGAVGETLNVDYFQVYGPVKYRPPEMLYIGAAADFGAVEFNIAKFRGQRSMKRKTGEADEIRACRKDAAGTFSWQIVV